MKYIKLFEQFINEALGDDENCLHKIYLATKRSSGQRWLTYKGFAGNKFFTQVTENNMDKLDINPDYPVLNYHSDITNELLKKGKIKKENIYNLPEIITKSGSKEEFHKLIGEDENIPKTVYTVNDAEKILKFPIIAKPASGHSGIGIQVVKTKEDLKDLNGKFDTFSEFIDKAEEHRFFNFRGKPFFWMERTPLNDKAKTGDGDTDEEMHFGYARRNIENIPNDIKKVLSKFCEKFSDFPYICFDLMRDKSGKIYIIESNAQPGVPFDSTVALYEKIYEDFYKKPLSEKSKTKLEEYAKQMIGLTLKRDNKRFSVKD